MAGDPYVPGNEDDDGDEDDDLDNTQNDQGDTQNCNFHGVVSKSSRKTRCSNRCSGGQSMSKKSRNHTNCGNVAAGIGSSHPELFYISSPDELLETNEMHTQTQGDTVERAAQTLDSFPCTANVQVLSSPIHILEAALNVSVSGVSCAFMRLHNSWISCDEVEMVPASVAAPLLSFKDSAACPCCDLNSVLEECNATHNLCEVASYRLSQWHEIIASFELCDDGRVQYTFDALVCELETQESIIGSMRQQPFYLSDGCLHVAAIEAFPCKTME